ncbi:hypothetical protein [Marinomonas fungiae]|uniref:hypothetical protein n=1 Tax=Marinomonas fungiae TaxID=1137284 RepID=UPI003A936E6E
MSDLSEKELLEIIAAKALLDTANQLRLEDIQENFLNKQDTANSIDRYLQEANNLLWKAKQALK